MFCIYYPDEGRYSVAMSLKEARHLQRQFPESYIVEMRTGEVFC